MTLKAIVFDFDGTIVDSEVPDYESWEEIFQTYGTSISLAEWSNFVGGGPDDLDPYAMLEKQSGRVINRDAIRPTRRARFHELADAQPIMPGVMKWLDDAKAAGLKLAVASSSSAEWVNRHLELRNLTNRFEAVRTRDDVARVKPDPTLYRLAVEALGVAPQEAVAIEDSRNGMLAAKTAGLHCIVVPNAITDKLDFSEADIRLKSLTEMSVADLIERF